MTAGWNDLPLEIKLMIVEHLDIISRSKLSTCSKLDRAVVRKAKFYVDRIEFDLASIGYSQKYPDVNRHRDNRHDEYRCSRFDLYIEHKDQIIGIIVGVNGGVLVHKNNKEIILQGIGWKDIIMNVFSSVSWKISTTRLFLSIGGIFHEVYEWLRENIDFDVPEVCLDFNEPYENELNDVSIEQCLDWPSTTNILWGTYNYRGPVLERLNVYHNISDFWFLCENSSLGSFDDETLKKVPNAKFIFVEFGSITGGGLNWWLKKWLLSDNGRSHTAFTMTFKIGHEMSHDDVFDGLETYIKREKDPLEQYSGADYGKLYKVGKDIHQIACLFIAEDLFIFSYFPNDEKLSKSKREMDVPLVGNKRKKSKKEKPFISFNVPLIKPGGKKYSEIDFEEYKQDKLKIARDDDEEDSRFHNYDAIEIVRILEAKHNKKGKKKKYRFNEDDFINNSTGYDLEDAFIDDSEAFEEVLPSTMETIKGGFYVNRGTLELKQLDEQSEIDEGESDEEPTILKKKNKDKAATNAPESDDEGPSTSNKIKKPVEKEIQRMTGAPPTKRAGPGPSSTADNEAKRKRLVGMPPTLKKPSTVSQSAPEKEKSAQKEKTPPLVISKPAAVTPKPPIPVPTTSSSSSSDIICIDDTPVMTSSSRIETPTQATQNSNSVKKVVPTPPSPSTLATNAELQAKRNLLTAIANLRKLASVNPAPIVNVKLTKLLEQFNKLAEEDIKNGKKRLSENVVNCLIKIEDQMKADSSPKEVKQKVFEGISSIVSVSVATIKNRMQQRRNEIEEANKKSQNNDDIQVLSDNLVPSSSSASFSLPGQGKRLLMARDIPHFTEIQIISINNLIKNYRNVIIISDMDVINIIERICKEKLDSKLVKNNLTEYFKNQAMTTAAKQGASSSTEKVLKEAEPVAKQARKSRVYLNVWVEESKLYHAAQKQLGKLMNKIPPSQNTIEQAQKMTKTKLHEVYQKQREQHAFLQLRATMSGTPKPNFEFSFTDPIMTQISLYADLLFQYAYTCQDFQILFAAFNILHQVVKDTVPKAMFYIELCRRLPKMSCLLDEPEGKKTLDNAKMSTRTFQVVQNSKFALKWPQGQPQSDSLNVPKNVPSTSTASKTLPAAISQKSSASTTPVKSATNSSQASPSPANFETIAAVVMAGVMTSQVTDAQIPEKIRQLLGGKPTTMDVAIVFEMVKKKVNDYIIARSQEAFKMKEEEERKKKLQEEERKKKLEEERKKKLEDDKKLAEKRRLEHERLIEEKRKAAEEKKRQMEQERIEREKLKAKLKEEERIEKEKLKAKLKEEERLRKEKEAQEARERKIREEQERQRQKEKLERELAELRRKQEEMEALRKEEERQRQLEKEAADALQELEQDNLMDDMEFVQNQEKIIEQEKMKYEQMRKEKRNQEIEALRQIEEANAKLAATSQKTVKEEPMSQERDVRVKQEPMSQEIQEADAIMQNYMSKITNNGVQAPTTTAVHQIPQQQQQVEQKPHIPSNQMVANSPIQPHQMVARSPIQPQPMIPRSPVQTTPTVQNNSMGYSNIPTFSQSNFAPTSSNSVQTTLMHRNPAPQSSFQHQQQVVSTIANQMQNMSTSNGFHQQQLSTQQNNQMMAQQQLSQMSNNFNQMSQNLMGLGGFPGMSSQMGSAMNNTLFFQQQQQMQQQQQQNQWRNSQIQQQQTQQQLPHQQNSQQMFHNQGNYGFR